MSEDERTLRARAAAWDFLAAQGEVPGATLADYLDAAGAYAYDETGVDLAATPRDGGGHDTMTGRMAARAPPGGCARR